MNFAILKPPPQISGIVRYFWTLESTSSSFIPPKYLAMADSSPELIFQYKGGFNEFGQNSAYLIAQRSKSNWRTLNQNSVGFFGVRFYPHALYKLTGIPANELNDHFLGLDTIFGNEGSDLSSQVLEAKTTNERITEVSNFLTRISKRKGFETTIAMMRYIMQTKGQATIDGIKSSSNLSLRQLQRKFKASIGFSPKYLLRMHRFQESKRKYVFGNFHSLTQLAYECGYSDQSHFNREFKEFSGMSPKSYFDLIKRTEMELNITKGLVSSKDLPSSPKPYQVITDKQTSYSDRFGRALLVGHET